MTTPRIIVHGGAGDWEGHDHQEVVEGVREALIAGWDILNNGGSALDAVEQATIVLEENPLYDSGFGSFVNEHGEVEMDALIVDGRTFKFGGVGAVKRVKNPILLARLVMTDTKHCFIVGDGADQLAERLNLKMVGNLEMVTEKEYHAFLERRKKPDQDAGPGLGTVGAVAIDRHGNIASATSTGGVPNKLRGRVGDTPIFGAGGYADNQYGATSATGIGENIMRSLLSKLVVDNIANGMTAIDATTEGVGTVAKRISDPEVGVICVDAQGHVGAAHTTRHMPIAWIDANGEVQASMGAPYNFS